MLDGYKTYIVGTVAVLAGIYLETITTGSGAELILIGLAAMGLRHAEAKTAAIASSPIVQEVKVPVEVPCTKCVAKKTKKAVKAKK